MLFGVRNDYFEPTKLDDPIEAAADFSVITSRCENKVKDNLIVTDGEALHDGLLSEMITVTYTAPARPHCQGVERSIERASGVGRTNSGTGGE